jgi:hypothetical protein
MSGANQESNAYGVTTMTITSERRARFARRVLEWNAWFFVGVGTYLLVMESTNVIRHDVVPLRVVVPGLLWVVPGAVVLLTRPTMPTTVRWWLGATCLGDFGWAVAFGLDMTGPGPRPVGVFPVSVFVALIVFGFLSVRGALEIRSAIKMDLEPWRSGSGDGE